MPMNTTLLTRCGDACDGARHLFDDLARIEMALEAGLTRRAERARHRASGL